MRAYLVIAVVALLGVAQPVGAASAIGETVFTRGGVTQEPAAGGVRIIAKGSPLYQGDVLRTGAHSYAVLRFNDGTRATVRPNSVFKVEKFSHDENAPASKETAFMRLFKGGLRLITGLVGKRNRDGFRLTTAVATIGIRGTDFEARLCDAECVKSAARVRNGGRKIESPVVARIAFMTGTVTAKEPNGETRALSLGGSLFEGDVVESGAHSLAVVVFRDESRLTLRPQSKFKIENHHYDPEAPKKSSMLMRFLRGGIRLVTGLIAKTNPENYRVSTPVATLSVRGTGFELRCQGTCGPATQSALPAPRPVAGVLDSLIPTARAQAANGLDVWVFSGAVALLGSDGTMKGLINQNQAVFFDGIRPVVYPAVPQFLRNQPVPANDPSLAGQDLTGTTTAPKAEEGLYVRVVKGDVAVTNQSGAQSLAGAGEMILASSGAGAPPPERVVPTRRMTISLQLPNPKLFEDPAFNRLQVLPGGGEPAAGEKTFECVVK